MESKFSLRALGIFLFLCLPAFAGEPGDLPADSLYQARASWVTPAGSEIHLSDFRGHPVLITMVYTRCQYTCPMTVAKLKAIEKSMSSTPDLKIVLVSFDQKNDTPQVLASFMKEKGLDPAHWQILAGKRSGSVRELAALLEISYKQEKNGEFSHSNVITLLDKNGVKRFALTGIAADSAPLVKAAQAL